MSRIGCQAQRSTPEAIAFARRSPIVKGVNQTEVLAAAPDDAIRIFRYVFNSQGLSDPAGACSQIVNALGGYRHPNLYVETLNEMPKDALGGYIAFLQAIVPMLHSNHLKVCGPSWASGDYERDDWNSFRSATWCGLDAIAVHGYWADRGPTEWNALRWRLYYNRSLDRSLPVFITECGRDRVRDGDGGVYIGHGGWKSDGLSATDYTTEINNYGAQLLAHEWALPFVNGPEATWVNYDMDPISPMIDTTTPPPGVPPVTLPTPPPYPSPNHGGARATTTGVVIHATLGGSATPLTEYNATINWFNDTASQVSAHAVVGPAGQVAYPVDPANEAWHCRASNATHLGIEMCKARLGDKIEESTLNPAAEIVARWCKTYNIPIVWSTTHGIEEHRNMPTNTDGHQDVGGPFDRADFLHRVRVYTGEDMTDVQKKAVLDDLDFLWSYSAATQTTKNPAEAEKVMHERIAALKVTLGLQ